MLAASICVQMLAANIAIAQDTSSSSQNKAEAKEAEEERAYTGESVEGDEENSDTETAFSGEEVEEGGSVTTRAKPRRLPDAGQASSTVTREELQERQPRSAPDALRYEEGVFVQQTAHSQGSAFIRGRTGQQTVLMFDDVRLNNSLFRQGPNQYFFTIDSRTIDHIDVVRGSASTRYGTDAIAGAINAVPLEPTFEQGKSFRFRPMVNYRISSADGESGGRLGMDTQITPNFGILAGFGARTVGQLESGGIVYGENIDGEQIVPEVPRFEEDERTQKGTGFDEITGDIRAVYYLDRDKRAVVGHYVYRQYDAPRTDNCAPAYAPFDECLQYDEQFRTLTYGALEGNWGPLAKQSRLIFSKQSQHEQRTYDRPSSQVINRGEDDVDTYGVMFRAATERRDLHDNVAILGRYGGEVYRDRVTSTASIELQNLNYTEELSRGLYLSNSRYSWGGIWSELEVQLFDQIITRAGGRRTTISAYAPEDPESGTLGVDKTWGAWIGNVGVEWWANDWLTLMASADQGFRAPNLDDMTSRQRTGPGFQIENPNLEPERGVTQEVGLQIANRHIEVDGWLYRSTLNQAISRTTRDVDACPEGGAPECRTTWARLQLVNLPGQARIFGAEGSLKLYLPEDIELQSTIAYAWGDGPRPIFQADNPDAILEDRVPLSRVPPLNGTVEGIWRSEIGFYLGAGMRWARAQDRLALSDISDERIPVGGTPGFMVLDGRVGWRFAKRSAVHAVFENLTDSAYRYHGSSVNGPGRSFTLQMEVGL